MSHLSSIVSGGEHTVEGCDYSVRLDARHLDDCAVISMEGACDLVIGTDYVRGPKFLLYERGFIGNADIGRFLVTANISDLAAMGASPIGMLVVVRYPADMHDVAFHEVMNGIDDACHTYGVRLLGGDTGSAERLILSGSAIGVCEHGAALARSKARAGDAVILTSAIGGAGAAVLAAAADLVPKLEPVIWESLVDCWRLPVAQPALGRWLSQSRIRIACQDISDGLRATAREIGELNGLSVVLERTKIPLHPGVESVARLVGVDPIALGLSASTDFSLFVTCCDSDVDPLLQGIRSFGHDGTVVGRLELGTGVWLEEKDGSLVIAPGVEWKHQAGDILNIVLGGLRGA